LGRRRNLAGPQHVVGNDGRHRQQHHGRHLQVPGRCDQPRSGRLGGIAYAQNGQADPGNPGVTAGNVCPLCNFQGQATGNIDTDATIDAWFISSKDASVNGSCGNSDTAAPAGTPFNTNNDVTC